MLAAANKIWTAILTAAQACAGKVRPDPAEEFSRIPADPDKFRCDIAQKASRFNIDIDGIIHLPNDMHPCIVNVDVSDITDAGSPQSVRTKIKQWQKNASGDFLFFKDIGKIPHKTTTLNNWTTIAAIELSWLDFARKGQRKLRFDISILSRENNQLLESATAICLYDNKQFGYLDIQENIRQAKTMAVALAFSVSAVTKKMFDSQIEMIKTWARGNIELTHSTSSQKRQLEKALNKTIAFFRDGNTLDLESICRELVVISSMADCCDIIDLCLHVARIKGNVVKEEVDLLSDLARWLQIDPQRFREMSERMLPATMHEQADPHAILGVSGDMDAEQIRHHLNNEYRKWNARVTNIDPQIQSQADFMLNMIATTRKKCLN
ncbi:MAG: hypothetical protein PHF37_05900 [Phycisphaerae bacterium]|nr:hypothetical protein [Phycisphaerae bacterium]